MHTQDSTPTPTHTAVQDLLDRLDQMEKSGVSAYQRLATLLDEGGSLTDSYNVKDSIDLQLRAHTRHLKRFEDLDGTLRTATAQFESAPFPNNVKESAVHMIEHLDKLVGEETRALVKQEIVLLSCLWEWSPPLTHMYEGLGTPLYPETPVKPAPPEIKKLGHVKEVLYQEWEDHCESLHKANEERYAKYGKKTAEAEAVKDPEPELPKEVEAVKEAAPPKFPLVTPRVIETERIVGTVSGQEPFECVVDPDPVASWTEALNQHTGKTWAFVRRWGRTIDVSEGGAVEGLRSEVYIWTSEGGDARLDFCMVAGAQSATLRIRVGQRVHKTTQRMDEAGVAALHENPTEFVASTMSGS